MDCCAAVRHEACIKNPISHELEGTEGRSGVSYV